MDNMTNGPARLKSLKRILCLVPSVLAWFGPLPAIMAQDWRYDTIVEPLPRPAWIEKVVLISESPWADASPTQPGRRLPEPAMVYCANRRLR